MARMPVPNRVSAFAPKGCPARATWRIIRRFHRLSACPGLVAYALRTRPPLSSPPKGQFPRDLHVLGLPPAFILSQDQTLRCTIVLLIFSFLCFHRARLCSYLYPRQCASRITTAGLVLASRCHRTPANRPSSLPHCRRLRVQKYYFLYYTQSLFSEKF